MSNINDIDQINTKEGAYPPGRGVRGSERVACIYPPSHCQISFIDPIRTHFETLAEFRDHMDDWLYGLCWSAAEISEWLDEGFSKILFSKQKESPVYSLLGEMLQQSDVKIPSSVIDIDMGADLGIKTLPDGMRD